MMREADKNENCKAFNNTSSGQNSWVHDMKWPQISGNAIEYLQRKGKKINEANAGIFIQEWHKKCFMSKNVPVAYLE